MTVLGLCKEVDYSDEVWMEGWMDGRIVRFLYHDVFRQASHNRRFHVIENRLRGIGRALDGFITLG